MLIAEALPPASDIWAKKGGPGDAPESKPLAGRLGRDHLSEIDCRLGTLLLQGDDDHLVLGTDSERMSAVVFAVESARILSLVKGCHLIDGVVGLELGRAGAEVSH